MKIFTGDLEPELEITISDTKADGTPAAVDLTEATTVRVIGSRGGTTVFDRPPTRIDVVGTKSVVRMSWEAGDTDTPGTLGVEVEATWPDDRPQTFRPDTPVTIVADYDHHSS